MSNLEHLIENGLLLFEREDITLEEWENRMRKDCNWAGNENITMDNLATICMYVIYTWCGTCENNKDWKNHER